MKILEPSHKLTKVSPLTISPVSKVLNTALSVWLSACLAPRILTPTHPVDFVLIHHVNNWFPRLLFFKESKSLR